MVYLDNAATTAIRPEVVNAMKPYLESSEAYGNPSSHHKLGRKARKAVETARILVANSIGAKPQEIIFTSGGSEADNLAIKGWSDSILLNSKKRQYITLMSSEIEHKAVTNSCLYVFKTKRDVDYTTLYVDEHGFVIEEGLRNALKYGYECGHKMLVSIMFANNEIGTIQNIKKLASICHEYGAVFHTDATQYYGHGEINVNELGIDMLTASGHKIGAPQGTGFLYVREGINIEPLIHGGGQERNRRAGTENVAGIVGLGKAASMIKDMIAEEDIVRSNLKYFYNYLFNLQMSALGNKTFEYLEINGVPPLEKIGGEYRRLANNLSLRLKDVDAQALLEMISDYGIYASAGSACNAGSNVPSHVLKAIGLTDEEANSTLRFTFNDDMTTEELEEAAEYLSSCLNMLRR